MPTRFFASSSPLTPRFRSLFVASSLTNLGDGVLLAAGPLLVASTNPEPAAVGGAVVVQQLPWLLFAVLGGALVDRVDRRRALVVANVCRAVVMAALTVSVFVDGSVLVVIYAALFLLGVGETLADNAASSLTVLVVPREQLGTANARLGLAFTLGNQLVGPPLGGFLFALGSSAPFVTHAVALGAAAVTASRIVTEPRTDTTEPQSEEGSFVRQTREGLRWVRRNAAMRTLVFAIVTMNVAFSAAFATWVLYATQVIGLTTAQFGLLMTCAAVGGLAAPWLYPRAEAAIGIAGIVQSGFLIEAGVHLSLALTPPAPIVAIIMVLFGAHTMIWGAAALTLRQHATPDFFLGRVNGVYATASLGGSALGAALGAVVAQRYGLTAGFWGAGVAMLLVAASSRRRVRDLAAVGQAAE